MEAVAATIGASMISAILEPMVKRAGTMIVDQWGSKLNIRREIHRLHSTLRLIQGIIQDAEEKQVNNINIRDWLRELVDIGYEARDVLDDFFTFCASTRAKGTSRSVKLDSLPFCFSLSCFNVGSSSSVPVALPFRLRSRLASDIRSVRERLDEMMRQMEIVSILKPIGDGSSKSAPMLHRPEIGPFVNKQRDLFVGREDVKEEIMKKLIHPNDNGVHLVSLWGMGGIGKTTLAQYIYNDERVKEEDYPNKNRRWLFVGEKKFNAKEIIMSIIEEPYNPGVELIQKKLVEKFKGDKFLIVLDDVWDLDSTEWNLLWDPLTNVGKGGVIIITTRIGEVISATNTKVPKDLRPLSDDDCWKIFKSHAFVDGKSNNRPELELIGQQIVKKLDGLPLATQVVGSSLLNEPYATWTNFLETWESTLQSNDNKIMAALRWSYKNLPQHLKQCFAYCALFPKDHVFNKKTLVEMWMAHDLIQTKEKERPEDVGAKYFQELVYASLFQCVDERYMMHDMIHDFVLLVSNEEFAVANGSFSVHQREKVRHITITSDNDYSKNLSLCKSKRILTVYTLFNEWYARNTTPLDKDVLLEVFKQWKSIRVLVLSRRGITDEILECISELRHLRYLDITLTSIKCLPDSLCDLYNLQTLAAPLDAVLPKVIVNMVNLRHLRANLTTYEGITKLTSLQELSSICICEDGYISELGNLRELRGKLTIKGLENVTSSQDAAQALMGKKSHIDQLELVIGKDLKKATIVKEVLDSLRCPPKLIHLKIDQYSGFEYPSWMENQTLLSKLQTIKLSECYQLKLLPPLGDLKSLKRLSLCWMHEVERLGCELYGKGINGNVFFPSLETLSLGYMEKWKEWDDIIVKDTSASFFPCLRKLRIFYCPVLVLVLPRIEICTSNSKGEQPILNAVNVMRSLSQLDMDGCHGLRLLKLDDLVSLKYLFIRNCSNLTCITLAIHVAATIEELSIKSCEKLKTVDCESLPSLRKLSVEFCLEIISIPHVAATIEELSITFCGKLKTIGFESLPSLRNLTVENCNEIISIPHLVRIEELNLRNCRKLMSLTVDRQGLDSLRKLRITRCPSLELIYEERSTSSSSSSSSTWSRLQKLHIDNEPIFRSIFEQDLISIKYIIISENTMIVECLGEVMKNSCHKLKLLEYLCIEDCKQLQSLPTGCLPHSLEKLLIFDCPQLQSMPAGGLPLSLKQLQISDCPLLYKRCKDESGLDWHKIKHIRDRQIDK